MVSKKSNDVKLVKMNKALEKELRDLANQRFKKDLDTEVLPMGEITRIIRTTPSWNKVIKDLQTIPHKNRVNPKRNG